MSTIPDAGEERPETLEQEIQDYTVTLKLLLLLLIVLCLGCLGALALPNM